MSFFSMELILHIYHGEVFRDRYSNIHNTWEFSSQPTQRDTSCFATCVPAGAGEGGKPPFDPSFNAREKEAV
jgi:hypothetical protein